MPSDAAAAARRARGGGRRPPWAEALAVGLGAGLLGLGLLWPLPRVVGTGLATAPGAEGPAHLWSWWALGAAGHPLRAQVPLVAWPEGLPVHGIDPLHGLLYQLGALAGPGAGFALVQLAGLAVAGLGAWALAREAGADRPGRLLAAALGTAAPTVVGAAVDGITEGLGAGWVGLQLALLLGLLRQPGPGRAVAWGLALAAAAWSGPYNAVFSALVSGPVLLWHGRRARWTLPAGALGLVLAAPVLRAALALEAGRPGAAGRTPAERPGPAAAGAWRGAWREGADLLDLVLPDVWTGAAAAPTTAYLGPVLLALVAAGLWRGGGRGHRAWAAGAALAAAVALGPWLVVAGQPVVVGSAELRPPAALLELVPVLGRLSRWYRAGAVAVLLAAPVAALAVRGLRPVLVLALGLVAVLDLRLGSPVPWPVPVVPLPLATVLVDQPGPFFELPPVHPLGQPPLVADENLLHQVIHGQPSNATRNNRRSALADTPPARQLQRAVIQGGPDGAATLQAAAAELAGLGFQRLVLYPARLPPAAGDRAAAALGPPVAQDAAVVVFALPAGTP